MGSQEITREETNIIHVPKYYYAIDVNHLLHLIADMLNKLTLYNDQLPLTPSNLTRFHSRVPPTISLKDYLCRIVKFTSVEKSCLLTLLIYIDRICELAPQFTISSLTVHRFLITAVTVSSKALSDSYCTNTHYAKVGGVSTQEMNSLELAFLSLINWHLMTTGPVLQKYYTNLIEQHPQYKRDVSNETNNPEKIGAFDYCHKDEGFITLALTPNKNNKTLENSVDNDSKSEKKETLKIFDTLLNDDSIPYIA